MSKSKRKSSPIVDSAQVLQALTTVLQHHLPLELTGTRITLEELYEILAYASVHESSLHTACHELAGASSGNRVRVVLMHALPGRRELQRQLNTALRAQVPRAFFKGKRRYEIAIDLTLIPYHGTAREAGDVLRAQAKAGTNHFHGSATVSVVHDRQRYVLALRFVPEHETMVDIARTLLDRVRRLKIFVRRVYLDKEFYAVEVLRMLDRRHLAHVLPVPLRGKSGRGPAPCRTWKSTWTTYTMQPHRHGSYPLRVVVVKRHRGKGQHKVVRCFIFAAGGLSPRTPPRQVFEWYRRRFGIETSYWQMNQVRARTSSRDMRLRLLLVGLALLLVNLYVRLRRALSPDRCRRPCAAPLLSLQQLADHLARAVEEQFRLVPLQQVRPALGFS